MYYINELKRKRSYAMPLEPKFKTKASKLAWLREQAMNARLANIKAINIQIRDIKAFPYAGSEDMMGIYRSFRSLDDYDDNEYITLYNYDSRSRNTIAYIIDSSWFTNRDTISEVDSETIRKEIEFLENRMIQLENKISDVVINQCYEHCKFRKEELERILVSRSQGLKLV